MAIIILNISKKQNGDFHQAVKAYSIEGVMDLTSRSSHTLCSAGLNSPFIHFLSETCNSFVA